MKKEIKFVHCERCNNIFIAGPDHIRENMVCGNGCGGSLKIITKIQAMALSEEKRQNESV